MLWLSYLSCILQRIAEEFAKAIGDPIPAALNDLLDVIWAGCDLKTILGKTGLAAQTPEIDTVAGRLQVCTGKRASCSISDSL